MPRIDIVIESKHDPSIRVQQVECMFDIPATERRKIEWHGDIDLEGDWNIGLIVGPSGSGKTVCARELFGKDNIEWSPAWSQSSVLDDFDARFSLQEITECMSAIGFNTIPAWTRPFHVLSNGEQFRVSLARRMLEQPDPIVCDEFTSVVDRQVAQICSHALQKLIRKRGRKFIALSCHYDVIDWLQPDWICEMPIIKQTRRALQRRPNLSGCIARTTIDQWKIFAPFHYLTNTLNTSAKCFALYIDEQPVSFAGLLIRPGATMQTWGISRVVTLPDWQGLGLAFILMETIGAWLAALKKRLHHYPAHPSFIRSCDRNPNWSLIRKQKAHGLAMSRATTLHTATNFGCRPCATFRYIGPAWHDADEALKFWNGK